MTLIFLAVFADVLTPYGVDEMRVMDRLVPPSASHLLGGDQVGRDILTRLIYGARISMVVGVAGTSVTVIIASIIGVPSGFFGGKYDIIVQRFVDAFLAFPGLLILLTVLSIVGPGILQIILVLGILTGIYSSRVVRSAVIGIKENDYFLAAEAIGSPITRTVMRHIMPNIMAPLIIIFSINIGGIILDEASLSFLGFGLPPEVPSWGGMLSWEGRRYMEVKPELALYPGLCLALVIFGVNMFGDAVRDLLDPRLRGG
ncbi:MAG: ABC transporter permease [Dehalococcoidia bacterium]|nr:ABC transporter permease [Dehalococcoidia bacterium]